ncbi:MAG: glycosyltransferase, partial [Rhodospirillaceae bacterium]|nr:glycosyltransferase [Rhodospirillaceae bacterium]
MKALSFYKDLFAEYASIVNANAVDIMKVAALGKKLKLEGFQAESDVCFRISINVMQNFIKGGQVDNALAMENVIYSSFVKTTETEEHYHECFKHWVGPLQELGRKQRAPRGPDRDRNKVCFVMQNAVLLGHTEVMLKTIDSWIEAKLGADLYVAALGGVDPSFANMLKARSIQLLQPMIRDGRQLQASEALPHLRQQLKDLNIHTMVWLSVPTAASYALPLQLAPRQVFWSLKFHPVFVPEADVHISDGHESEVTRVYNGQQWTVAPFPLTVALKDNKPEDVKAYRTKFPKDAVLLGTLAREEKITSPTFLSAVCAILARNPKAHYLWTGREQPAPVLAAFQGAGVAQRCHFIGWVDTNLVAEALDVFLETFPFGCGVTGFQAMRLGTPLLSMQAADTLYSRTAARAKLAGRVGSRADMDAAEILTAADPQHYVELA